MRQVPRLELEATELVLALATVPTALELSMTPARVQLMSAQEHPETTVANLIPTDPTLVPPPMLAPMTLS